LYLTHSVLFSLYNLNAKILIKKEKSVDGIDNRVPKRIFWAEERERERRQQEVSENCVMKSFIICVVLEIL
jgi:hypothetical protein